jgi:hypothetical protein
MKRKTIKASPSWSEVKTKLTDFDRGNLIDLVRALYSASQDNKTFLHTRFCLGDDPLETYKDVIIYWINPPDFRNLISVSKAKKAINDQAYVELLSRQQAPV